MASDARLVTAGVVGRAHGLDGSFTVERAVHPLEMGTVVKVAEHKRTIERRDGTDKRPLVRLDGIGDRESAQALHGEVLLVEAVLEEGEWLADDLVGCRVEGLGEVQRVIPGPSCDVLELDGGQLVPLIGDAVKTVDVDGRRIEVDTAFLSLDGAE